jgi:hypothetical protein
LGALIISKFNLNLLMPAPIIRQGLAFFITRNENEQFYHTNPPSVPVSFPPQGLWLKLYKIKSDEYGQAGFLVSGQMDWRLFFNIGTPVTPGRGASPTEFPFFLSPTIRSL